MKKFIFIATLIALGCPVLAEEIIDETPIQEIENTKAYTGINYNRQDSEKVGRQKIVNDHSWFNINVQIIKKGALFSDNKEEAKE